MSVDDFPGLLRRFRERRNLSGNKLSQAVGCNPSYLSRIEGRTRGAPTINIVEVLSRTLKLTPYEDSQFMVAAGFAPPSLRERGWCDVLQSVTDVLDDVNLPEHERQLFGQVVCEIAARWRSVGVRREEGIVDDG